MKNKRLKSILSVVFFATGLTLFAQPNDKDGKKKPPKAEQLLKEMDANKDGKLAKSELKGPIKDDFIKIDTNKDGFLSLEELKKAPKPERPRPDDKK
ncbi:MAG: EF-hand domain-containing protein [Flavobacteriaceae bacterium]|jgi:Ca2+-binding EF-hand superfamily protein|uniref:EF-hand domain-containing protein n=1 Tax=Flavobacterium kayseriense TaxID=2764714 RepID=A0ABR7J5U4_9FLAO|nr:EF-hand domain-containing protein [Flavobacterium kayseriense]MBC5840823.1 EF-hand domain-containing protein [Flavobacterium kayseriense]MBC5846507.1 EF-hand domain-containing protein [Flavobacterium kayseriense]MBU0940991.1 EF-hand domain-containing protein [Bacteroidota bacterium]MBX9888748.1 EF-hand domain-containing protein [Flavobacteriaceae bacterium]